MNLYRPLVGPPLLLDMNYLASFLQTELSEAAERILEAHAKHSFRKTFFARYSKKSHRLMSPATTVESMPGVPASLRLRVAQVLGIVVFVGLLGLLVITAIPYGTAEAWWKAFFICAAFSLGILWLIEGYLAEPG